MYARNLWAGVPRARMRWQPKIITLSEGVESHV